MMKKLFCILTVILCVMLVQASVMAEENAAAYLKEYYDIVFEGDVSAADYNAALTALGAEPLDCESLTLADAVVGAVRLAGMEELAQVYGSDTFPNSVDILAQIGIAADESNAPYIVCAVNGDLVDDEDDFSGPVSADRAADLLYRAAEIAGKGRHYIGRISDDDILLKLRTCLDSISIFSDEVLNDTGIDILIRGASTGYSLKYSGFEARFLEGNTIRYGHDTINHLMQLAALMQSTGFDAYVQIEPKVSVYEYLLEWGTPSDPTPTYMVQKMDDRYFAFALEFDMVLEFDTVQQKEAFHHLVDNFAKKYDDSFDADGNLVKPLLDSSFWQPLYFSTTEMENQEYMPLVDNVIGDKAHMYFIHSISLPENAEAVAEAVKQIAPDLEVSAETVYVNPAFYRYITGTDHQ